MAAILGVLAQGLKNDGGFSDARIAAHQQGGARHQPAAGDAVEFGDAGGTARRRRVLGFQVFQGNLAALRPAGGA